MNNLLSYCGLVDARISTSEKDLPVRFFKDWTIFKGKYPHSDWSISADLCCDWLIERCEKTGLIRFGGGFAASILLYM